MPRTIDHKRISFNAAFGYAEGDRLLKALTSF